MERRSDGSVRLTIENEEPEFVARVIVRGGEDVSVVVGEHIEVAAILSPPAGPIVPNGYNFARDAFLKGIDAQGFVVSPIERSGSISKTGIDVFRQRAAEVLYANIGGQNGAIAAALLVGEKSYLSETTKENLREAGLAHLLAISGLHIGLVAAIGFFVFEYIFAHIPALAFRVMPKKLAVLPTFLVVLTYLFISGASVATIRAVIMISVAMAALLTDRRVISLRSVAIAAILILLIWPENIVSISFQLSFAATASLVAFYEWFSRSEYWRSRQNSETILGRSFSAVLAVALTSLISQIGILPFALYHFQEISVIALLSNVLVLPIISFCVMPLLLCFLISWSVFGIAGFTALLNFFIGFVGEIAAWCASFSWATIQTPQLAGIGFFLLSLVFIGALLFRGRMVVSCLSLAVPIIFLMSFREPVDVLIDRNARFVAVKNGDQIAISSRYRDNFRNKAWLKYWAAGRNDVRELEKNCDMNACMYDLTEDKKLAIVRNIDAVKTACSAADIIILPHKYKRYCRTDKLILTERQLAKRGPLGLLYNTGSERPELKWSVAEL